MKNLIEFIVIHIVTHPEEVNIVEETDNQGTVYTIHVHPEDVGRVIGKGGSVIHSIRNIAKIRALREGIRAKITLADETSEE